MNNEFPILGRGHGVGLLIFAILGFVLYRHPFSGGGMLLVVPAEAMRIVLSLVLTAASLFVILRKDYGPKDKHWAYATIGTILGFWLRGQAK